MQTIKWTNSKPKRFKEDCLLLTADLVGGFWNYTLFEIRKTDGYNDNDEPFKFEYWGVFDHDDEWGNYADLKANKYSIFPALKIK